MALGVVALGDLERYPPVASGTYTGRSRNVSSGLNNFAARRHPKFRQSARVVTGLDHRDSCRLAIDLDDRADIDPNPRGPEPRRPAASAKHSTITHCGPQGALPKAKLLSLGCASATAQGSARNHPNNEPHRYPITKPTTTPTITASQPSCGELGLSRAARFPRSADSFATAVISRTRRSQPIKLCALRFLRAT